MRRPDVPESPPAACAACAACAAYGARDGCPAAPSRRRFLRDAAFAACAAAALPLGTIAALGGAGDTRRYPIPAADGVRVDRESEVILVRWQGAVYAFNLACPHQRTALRWQEREARFQCPKHRSRYRPDGTFIEGRATRGMDRLAVARDGADVVVDLATLHRQDTDPARWAAAVVRLG